jgi:hypothetical protein
MKSSRLLAPTLNPAMLKAREDQNSASRKVT